MQLTASTRRSASRGNKIGLTLRAGTQPGTPAPPQGPPSQGTLTTWPWWLRRRRRPWFGVGVCSRAGGECLPRKPSEFFRLASCWPDQLCTASLRQQQSWTVYCLPPTWPCTLAAKRWCFTSRQYFEFRARGGGTGPWHPHTQTHWPVTRPSRPRHLLRPDSAPTGSACEPITRPPAGVSGRSESLRPSA